MPCGLLFNGATEITGLALGAECRRLVVSLAHLSEDLVEGPTELDVEERVDDGIDETIDVAEPHEEGEHHRVDVTDGCGYD